MTEHEDVDEATIRVVSKYGRLLNPCRPEVAAREVAFGRAQWVERQTIRLMYDPFRIRRYRLAVLRRDDYRCVWCGDKADTVDHIIPWSRGGSWFVHNLMAACSTCNHERLDIGAREYLAQVHARVPDPGRVLRLIEVAEREEICPWREHLTPDRFRP